MVIAFTITEINYFMVSLQIFYFCNCETQHPTLFEENLEIDLHSENVIGDEITAVNLPNITSLFQSSLLIP